MTDVVLMRQLLELFELEGPNERPLHVGEESVLGSVRIETMEPLVAVKHFDVLTVESRLEQRLNCGLSPGRVGQGPDHAVRRVRDEVVPVGGDFSDHGDDPVQRWVSSTTPNSSMVWRRG